MSEMSTPINADNPLEKGSSLDISPSASPSFARDSSIADSSSTFASGGRKLDNSGKVSSAVKTSHHPVMSSPAHAKVPVYEYSHYTDNYELTRDEMARMRKQQEREEAKREADLSKKPLPATPATETAHKENARVQALFQKLPSPAKSTAYDLGAARSVEIESPKRRLVSSRGSLVRHEKNDDMTFSENASTCEKNTGSAKSLSYDSIPRDEIKTREISPTRKVEPPKKRSFESLQSDVSVTSSGSPRSIRRMAGTNFDRPDVRTASLTYAYGAVTCHASGAAQQAAKIDVTDEKEYNVTGNAATPVFINASKGDYESTVSAAMSDVLRKTFTEQADVFSKLIEQTFKDNFATLSSQVHQAFSDQSDSIAMQLTEILSDHLEAVYDQIDQGMAGQTRNLRHLLAEHSRHLSDALSKQLRESIFQQTDDLRQVLQVPIELTQTNTSLGIQLNLSRGQIDRLQGEIRQGNTELAQQVTHLIIELKLKDEKIDQLERGAHEYANSDGAVTDFTDIVRQLNEFTKVVQAYAATRQGDQN